MDEARSCEEFFGLSARKLSTCGAVGLSAEMLTPGPMMIAAG
jgi:hypothetical protein